MRSLERLLDYKSKPSGTEQTHVLHFNILALFLSAEDQIPQLCKWEMLANFDLVLSKIPGEGRNVATAVSSGRSGSTLAHLFTPARCRTAPLRPFQAFSAISPQHEY